jgi:hypothetical protein
MYVSTKELPACVQRELKNRSYNRRDIKVEGREKVSPFGAGSAGNRDYVVIINLETGASETKMGSWGGSNMFNPTNQVDLDTSEYTIPQNGLVIKGCEGHHNFATVYVCPANVQTLLPAPADISERLASILGYFQSYKAAYRKEQFQRMGVTAEEFQTLLDGGYIKQNKAGARQITTKGKNAAARVY